MWGDRMRYIYQIKNLINNKVYIGQTNDPERRKKRHFVDLRSGKHDNPHLQKAFFKYGEENFYFEILLQKECSQDEINQLEIEYIEKYNSYLDGYNCNRGGQQHNGFESKLKKEEILKIYAMLEFHKRPGTILGNWFDVSNTTISRINNNQSHSEYRSFYENMTALEREQLYISFCKELNVEPQIQKINEAKRKCSREQVFLVYIYQEFGNGKRNFLANDFGWKNYTVIDNIRKKITYKNYWELYQKITLREKITLLCHYMETYNRKPPELLENLLKTDNQQPSHD
jgi:group I intron endonuclease